jgi:hypothetical protein
MVIILRFMTVSYVVTPTSYRIKYMMAKSAPSLSVTVTNKKNLRLSSLL